MLTAAQVLKFRHETPGCEHVLHFNNAGAGLMSVPVLNAIQDHLLLESNVGGYESANLREKQLERFYDVTAALINAHRDEIAFAENATRAWDMIFYSLSFEPGDIILAAETEYPSNYLAMLQRAKQLGVVIQLVKSDEHGQVDLDDLRKKNNANVKLIAITHVPTSCGLVNPAEDIGKIAKEFGIPYLLDATQSVGQMPIDVSALHCDFLCATGRKFLRGPRGTGFLYVKKEKLKKLTPPFVNFYAANWTADDEYQLRDDARRFETRECYVAGMLGLAAAIEYAQQIGLQTIWERIQHLATLLREALIAIPQVKLFDPGITKCGIVTFSTDHIPAERIQAELLKQRINVNIVHGVNNRLNLLPRHLSAIVRLSVHYYNTEEEIERFCQVLKGIIA